MDNRPLHRKYTVKIVDDLINQINETAHDQELAKLFNNCFPNTLDTTVWHSEQDGVVDTFIITGDIEAMWLRDSTLQVWPYLELLPDEQIKQLLVGLINRQVKCILLDPYANAFNLTPIGSEWDGDMTIMQPLLHERKWELDSLCFHLKLATEYWLRTKDKTPFTNEFLLSAKLIYQTFIQQQRKEREDYYTFQRVSERATDTLADEGLGNPINPVGLIASSFRPSDDATIFPFLIPSNFFAVVELKRLAQLVTEIYADHKFAAQCLDLAQEVEGAIYKYGVHEHSQFGQIFAFEVDGFGSRVFLDDAGTPSLLSLPYLSAVEINNPIYQNTRKFILSKSNPWYFKGTKLHGVGSIHSGRKMVWPLAITMQALTSNDANEIKECIELLKSSHAGTYFIHESIHQDDEHNFTRPWFAWANTVFGELLLKIWRQTGF